MDLDAINWRYAYVLLAAIAGAITALASSGARKMSRMDMFLTFVVGFSFAIFVTPWVAVNLLGIDPGNVRAIAGLTYIFGAGSNVLLPVLIERFRRLLGYNPSQTVDARNDLP